MSNPKPVARNAAAKKKADEQTAALTAENQQLRLQVNSQNQALQELAQENLNLRVELARLRTLLQMSAAAAKADGAPAEDAA